MRPPRHWNGRKRCRLLVGETRASTGMVHACFDAIPDAILCMESRRLDACAGVGAGSEHWQLLHEPLNRQGLPTRKTKTPTCEGRRFCLHFYSEFLVARGGIEPPTQGFSSPLSQKTCFCKNGQPGCFGQAAISDVFRIVEPCSRCDALLAWLIDQGERLSGSGEYRRMSWPFSLGRPDKDRRFFSGRVIAPDTYLTKKFCDARVDTQ